jgi:hypothetical protein
MPGRQKYREITFILLIEAVPILGRFLFKYTLLKQDLVFNR